MATPAQPVAACIARWMYEQNSALLKALRAFIETAIISIDAQILAVRAAIAANDPVLVIEKFFWDKQEAVINKIKSNMLAGLPGPGGNLPGPDPSECPEFYQYIAQPTVGLLESSLAAFTPYKDRYMKQLSYADKLDRLLIYWEAAKAQMLAILDVLDDALYNVLVLEAANAVP